MKKFGRILICAIVLLSLVGCSFELNSKKLNVPTCDVYVTLKNGKINHHVIEGTTVPSDFLVRFGYMTAEEYAAMNAALDARSTRDAEPNHDDINAEAWWNIKALNFEKVDEVATRAFAVIEESLEEVVFNDNEIDIIGVEAFTKAKGLKVVYLAEVKEIRERAFYEANSGQPHTEVTINSDEVKLGLFAFGGEEKDLNPANVTINTDAIINQEDGDKDINTVLNNNNVNVVFHVPTKQDDFSLVFESEVLTLANDNKQIVNSTPKFDEANAAAEALKGSEQSLEGYEFKGWSVLKNTATDPNAEDSLEPVTKENIKTKFENGLIGDVDFYAVYEPKTVKITIKNLTTGASDVTISVKYGDVITVGSDGILNAKPAEDHYVKVENVEYQAQLSGVFADELQTAAKCVFVFDYESNPQTWMVKEVEGYTTADGNWICTEDKVLYAGWSVADVSVKVTFHLNREVSDGFTFEYKDEKYAGLPAEWNNTTNPLALTIGDDGETFVGFFTLGKSWDDVPAPKGPSNSGYSFGGWYFNYEDNSFTNSLLNTETSKYVIPPTGNTEIDVYAKWNASVYDIKYYDVCNTANTSEYVVGDSKSTLTEKHTYGKTTTLPTPEKTGYKFVDWSTGYVEVTPAPAATVPVSGYYTLKSSGVYEKCASGAVSDGSTTYYTKKTLTETKLGATAYSEDNTTAGEKEGDNKYITLYAEWEPLSYTIEYNLNGGDWYVPIDEYVAGAYKYVSSQYSLADGTEEGITFYKKITAPVSHFYGVDTDMSEVIPYKPGKSFAGWFVDETDGVDNKTPIGTAISGTAFSNTDTDTINLEAHWEIGHGGLIFDLNLPEEVLESAVQNVPAKQLIAIGENPSKPIDPVIPNYNFVGWYNVKTAYSVEAVAEKEYNFGYINTNTSINTIYAKWEPKQFDIKYYDVLVGENPSAAAEFTGVFAETKPTTHTYKTATTLKNPTKAGYEFGGWYTNATLSGAYVEVLGGDAYTESNTVEGSIALYAKWKPIDYAIEYYDGSNPLTGITDLADTHVGGVPTDLVFLTDSNASSVLANHPEKVFAGWYLDAATTIGLSELNEDNGVANYATTYIQCTEGTAEENVDYYKLVNGAYVKQTVTVDDPIDETYYYSENVDTTIKLYAGWEDPKTFAIEYKYKEYIPAAYVSGTSDSWTTLTVGTTLKDTPKTAHPTTHSNNGVTALSDASIKGYVFDGWYTDDEYTEAVTEIIGTPKYAETYAEPQDGKNGKITLYAKMNKTIKYDINYNLYVGDALETDKTKSPASTTDAPKTHTVGTDTELVEPTRENYLFNGWYKTFNTGSKTYSDGISTIGAEEYNYSNTASQTEGNRVINLYAKWTPIFRVKYELQGLGTNPSDEVIVQSSSTPKATKPEDPACAGYKFVGWYTDAECTAGKEWDFDEEVTKSMTLYAKWEPCKVRVFADTDTKKEHELVGEGGYTYDQGLNLNLIKDNFTSPQNAFVYEYYNEDEEYGFEVFYFDSDATKWYVFANETAKTEVLDPTSVDLPLSADVEGDVDIFIHFVQYDATPLKIYKVYEDKGLIKNNDGTAKVFYTEQEYPQFVGDDWFLPHFYSYYYWNYSSEGYDFCGYYTGFEENTDEDGDKYYTVTGSEIYNDVLYKPDIIKTEVNANPSMGDADTIELYAYFVPYYDRGYEYDFVWYEIPDDEENEYGYEYGYYWIEEIVRGPRDYKVPAGKKFGPTMDEWDLEWFYGSSDDITGRPGYKLTGWEVYKYSYKKASIGGYTYYVPRYSLETVEIPNWEESESGEVWKDATVVPVGDSFKLKKAINPNLFAIRGVWEPNRYYVAYYADLVAGDYTNTYTKAIGTAKNVKDRFVNVTFYNSNYAQVESAPADDSDVSNNYIKSVQNYKLPDGAVAVEGVKYYSDAECETESNVNVGDSVKDYYVKLVVTTAEYNSYIPLLECKSDANLGYRFNGWKNGTTVYNNLSSVKNLSKKENEFVLLNADWTALSVNAKLDYNGGNSISGFPNAFQIVTGEVLNKSLGWQYAGTGTVYHVLPRPTSSTGGFLGWYKEVADNTIEGAVELLDINGHSFTSARYGVAIDESYVVTDTDTENGLTIVAQWIPGYVAVRAYYYGNTEKFSKPFFVKKSILANKLNEFKFSADSHSIYKEVTEKVDARYTEVTGLSGGASVADYYTKNAAGDYVKCGATDTVPASDAPTYYKENAMGAKETLAIIDSSTKDPFGVISADGTVYRRAKYNTEWYTYVYFDYVRDACEWRGSWAESYIEAPEWEVCIVSYDDYWWY